MKETTTMTNIKIDLEKGYIYRNSMTRLEVVHPIDLVGKNGYYNNHKIVEVAPISNDLVVIKTIDWE
jgi:hypothetical protein